MPVIPFPRRTALPPLPPAPPPAGLSDFGRRMAEAASAPLTDAEAMSAGADVLSFVLTDDEHRAAVALRSVLHAAYLLSTDLDRLADHITESAADDDTVESADRVRDHARRLRVLIGNDTTRT